MKNKIFKYFVVMTKDEYNEYEDLILSGKSDTYLTNDKILEFEKRLVPINKRNKLLSDTINRNNKGIEFEKKGNIEKAIKVYEENIRDGYKATHSFDRLMIIYRKQKNYNDELRVINRYLEVFNETDEEFEVILNNPKNKQYREEILLGRETNTGVKNDDGWFIYNPHEYIKYIERLDKVSKKIKNSL